MVWPDNKLYKVDLPGGEPELLVGNTAFKEDIFISSNIVVWEDFRNGDPDIYTTTP